MHVYLHACMHKCTHGKRGAKDSRIGSPRIGFTVSCSHKAARNHAQVLSKGSKCSFLPRHLSKPKDNAF